MDTEKIFPVSNEKNIIRLADQCVKCGMCLPRCPTYLVAKNENESPRGRINLLDALARHQLEPSLNLVEHLTNCLSCNNCQTVCPAQVKYAELLQTGKNYLRTEQQIKLRNFPKFIRVLYHRRLRSILHYLGYFWGLCGRPKFSKASLLNFIPKLAWPKKILSQYQPDPQQPTVGLFLGCILPLVDQKLFFGVIEILNKLGLNVLIPREQTCCGSIETHYGELVRAAELHSKNQRSFTIQDLQYVLSLTPGCYAELKSQLKLVGLETWEVQSFLLDKVKVSELKLKKSPPSILIFEPCTQRNNIVPGLTEKFLSKFFPQTELVKIPAGYGCCGASGTKMLQDPEQANIYLEPMLSFLQNQDHTSLIACSNIGCQLHIQRALDKAGMQFKIYHPVQILAEFID